MHSTFQARQPSLRYHLQQCLQGEDVYQGRCFPNLDIMREREALAKTKSLHARIRRHRAFPAIGGNLCCWRHCRRQGKPSNHISCQALLASTSKIPRAMHCWGRSLLGNAWSQNMPCNTALCLPRADFILCCMSLANK